MTARCVPHVIRVLSSQLALGEAAVLFDVTYVLIAGALKTVESPVSLQLLLLGPESPQKTQVVGEVVDDLGVAVEGEGLPNGRGRVWRLQLEELNL